MPWGIGTKSKVGAHHLFDMPWIMHHLGTSAATVIERLFASCNLNTRMVSYSRRISRQSEMMAAGPGRARPCP